MSTRIISAVVAIFAATIILILHNTFVFQLAIAAVSVCAIYEIFKATGHNKFAPQTIICCSYALFDCISYIWLPKGALLFFNEQFILCVFLLLMFLSYLKKHDNFKYTDLFYMIGVGYLIPYSMDKLLSMNLYKNGGLFMIIITLCGAWLADSGAYFAGTFFGKTPLCPKISPKKTVEGVVGGVISNGVLMLIIGLFYQYVLKGVPLHYIPLFLCGMICALLGLVGDLTASMIKRQCGIKDYGNIMPGHGGVMDRFDSVLLVAPFMYYAFTQGWIMG